MKTHSDEDLMEEVSEGNLERLRILFQRHHLHVFNFLYKMTGDRSLSEDLTQETFYKILKYRSSYRKGSFISWLFTIARNLLSAHYRKNGPSDQALEEVEYKLANKENEEAEDYSQLYLALNALEPEDREILVLNRLNKIRYAEIAVILNITEGAAKTRVCRALKKLKEKYFEVV